MNASKKPMSGLVGLVAVTVMTAVNCLAFFALSFATIYGNGGPQVIEIVRIVGFGWIAMSAVCGYIYVAKGEAQRGLNFTAGTLPVGLAVALAWIVFSNMTG